MKKSIILLTVLLFGVAGVAQKKKDLIKQVAQLKAQNMTMQETLDAIEKAKIVNMEDELQTFSYAMGVTIGSDLLESGLDSISSNAFATALNDVMNGTEAISVEEANKKVRTTLEGLEEKRNAMLKAAGAAFLEENAKRPEVKTTESGLQYEVLTAAEGPKPTTADRVKVHYTGMLTDGEVFDSSVERGEPIEFAVTGVIKGWTEALQLMSVGSKYKLFIPYELAYGERGAGGGAIPPFAVLVFDVELLDIAAK